MNTTNGQNIFLFENIYLVLFFCDFGYEMWAVYGLFATKIVTLLSNYPLSDEAKDRRVAPLAQLSQPKILYRQCARGERL
jgi:hypothetical protein